LSGGGAGGIHFIRRSPVHPFDRVLLWVQPLLGDRRPETDNKQSNTYLTTVRSSYDTANSNLSSCVPSIKNTLKIMMEGKKGPQAKGN